MFLALAQLTNKAFTDASKGRIRQSLTALVYYVMHIKPVVSEDSYYRWIVISIYEQNVKWSLYRNSDVVIILPFLFNEDINLIGDVKFGRRTCQQLNLS